uniref:Uncharacterized protein n=1 Tax=Arundo donax TaxID=35708 RepID=A0A0A9GN35_ARUDO
MLFIGNIIRHFYPVL